MTATAEHCPKTSRIPVFSDVIPNPAGPDSHRTGSGLRDSVGQTTRRTVNSPVATVVRLTIGQRLALGMAVIMALVLAAYGAVGSYSTISDAAARAGVPFPQLVPIGIDGGLVGVVALDLILAWTGHPIGWLRQLTRLLTIGTVAANIAAGWPDPLAVACTPRHR